MVVSAAIHEDQAGLTSLLHLTALRLHQCCMEGAAPYALTCLLKLQHLDMWDCSSVTLNISGLTGLEYLCLHNRRNLQEEDNRVTFLLNIKHMDWRTYGGILKVSVSTHCHDLGSHLSCLSITLVWSKDLNVESQLASWVCIQISKCIHAGLHKLKSTGVCGNRWQLR